MDDRVCGDAVESMRSEKDGRSSYERLKGTQASLPGLEFGERILWRVNIKGDRKNKLDAVSEDGVYLGQSIVSGECLVGGREGMFRPRIIHRVPVEKRRVCDPSFVTGLP